MDATNSCRRELKRMKEYILSKTRIPQQTLIRRKNNDWTINAACCLEYGVCDVIAESAEDILQGQVFIDVILSAQTVAAGVIMPLPPG